MHAKGQQNLAPTLRPRHLKAVSIPLLLHHPERSKSSHLRSTKASPLEKYCISSSDFSCVCLHSHTTHPALLPLRAGLHQHHTVLQFLFESPKPSPSDSESSQGTSSPPAATFCFPKWQTPNKAQQNQAVVPERSQQGVCAQPLLGVLTSYNSALFIVEQQQNQCCSVQQPVYQL